MSADGDPGLWERIANYLWIALGVAGGVIYKIFDSRIEKLDHRMKSIEQTVGNVQIVTTVMDSKIAHLEKASEQRRQAEIKIFEKLDDIKDMVRQHK